MTETEALNVIQLFSFGLRIGLFWDFFFLTFFLSKSNQSLALDILSFWNIQSALFYVDRMIPKNPQAVP